MEPSTGPDLYRASVDMADKAPSVSARPYPRHWERHERSRDGTVLLVTHDHDVIDEVATRIWNFHGGKIDDFKGTYEEFVQYSDQQAAKSTAGQSR